jgi:hypothetical protein
MAGKYTNKFPKVGNEAYSSGAPRTGDMREGMVVPKKSTVGGVEPATAMRRTGIPYSAAGAAHRITAFRTAATQADEQAPTQANGRIMPSAVGSNNNFRSGGLTYGPM